MNGSSRRARFLCLPLFFLCLIVNGIHAEGNDAVSSQETHRVFIEKTGFDEELVFKRIEDFSSGEIRHRIVIKNRIIFIDAIHEKKFNRDIHYVSQSNFADRVHVLISQESYDETCRYAYRFITIQSLNSIHVSRKFGECLDVPMVDKYEDGAMDILFSEKDGKPLKLFLTADGDIQKPNIFATTENFEFKVAENFLFSQKDRGEGAKLLGSATSDLDGDGKPEVVLMWMTLGPTYWRNNLAVLTQTAHGYQPVSAKRLVGEAKLLSVKDGVIFVDGFVYADKDPICCPSVKKQFQFVWNDGEISERSAKSDLRPALVSKTKIDKAVHDKVLDYNGEFSFVYHGREYEIKGLPRFQDYPAEQEVSENHYLGNEWALENMSSWYLRHVKTFKQSANFNGHYAVITRGSDCTGCQHNWVANVLTGKLLGEFTTTYGVKYRMDSSLLIADYPYGRARNLDGAGGLLSHVIFYKVENDQLIKIKDYEPFKEIKERQEKN